jgi:hypothetical protein
MGFKFNWRNANKMLIGAQAINYGVEKKTSSKTQIWKDTLTRYEIKIVLFKPIIMNHFPL